MSKHGRCIALDMNGLRCKRDATALFTFHGDSELYTGFDEARPTWVAAPLCKEHADNDIPYSERRYKEIKRSKERESGKDSK